jgi:Rap1a immunity proteins
MRVVLMAWLIAISATAACAEATFENTAGFLKLYEQPDNLIARMYIRGIGDGISMYNAMVQAEGGAGVYCPPAKAGLADGQYVAIIKALLKKSPKAKELPVQGVLLYALKDAFPCN